MSPENLYNEELEDTGVEGEEDAEDVDESGDSDEASFSGSSSKAVAESEALEDFSIASRQKVRDEIEDQIAAFLARGGKINEVAPNVTADPPKKPTPDYGGRPI